MNKGQIVYDGNKLDLFENEKLLKEHNLSLPTSSILAQGLKEKGLIDFKHLPLTKEELLNIILGGKENE